MMSWNGYVVKVVFTRNIEAELQEEIMTGRYSFYVWRE
jgi:hypothetical protein